LVVVYTHTVTLRTALHRTTPPHNAQRPAQYTAPHCAVHRTTHPHLVLHNALPACPPGVVLVARPIVIRVTGADIAAVEDRVGSHVVCVALDHHPRRIPHNILDHLAAKGWAGGWAGRVMPVGA
jgi:hypothetical protein